MPEAYTSHWSQGKIFSCSFLTACTLCRPIFAYYEGRSITSSLRKVVCMFRIKFPTKRIFRIFPILRTDGMAPFAAFGTYLWNDPRIINNRAR